VFVPVTEYEHTKKASMVGRRSVGAGVRFFIGIRSSFDRAVHLLRLKRHAPVWRT
jgi:hypothetical protein